MPWLGRPFVGAANYVEALADRAVLERARAHRRVRRPSRSRSSSRAGWCWRWRWTASSAHDGLVRTAVLLPWAIPTVVAALVWRFMFESPAGLANAVLARLGVAPPTWFADAVAAWIPLVLADVWKTTPFVALLLLAGLQNIDRSLYEAADVDGAGPWRQFVEITLPLLRPALLVALPVPHARRLPRLRRRLRHDRRRTGHRHRADRAVHVQHAPAESSFRLRVGAVGDRLRRRVRVRARQHSRVWRRRASRSERHEVAARWALVTATAGGGDRSFRCTGP